MALKYIRIEKEAEESYSFVFGDELRKIIISPWKLPLLPINLTKRILSHRKSRSELDDKTTLTDCVFIFDLEKMREGDEKSFSRQALNYSANSISIGIGNPSINTKYDHLIPTRRELKIDAKEWNLTLEHFLAGIIRSYRPQRLVFVGKYPYAGLMSILRKCEPKKSFFWIKVRSDEYVVKERSEKFYRTKEISSFTSHDTIIRNTIFFDYSPSKELELLLKENGINMIQTKEHAEYMSFNEGEYDYRAMLMKNQTLFVCSKNQARTKLIVK